TKLEAGQRRTAAVGLFSELGIVSCEVDSDCLSDALDEKRTCLSAYQFFVQPFHQPVQIGISECCEVPQTSVLRVSSEDFFQGALNQRQLDEHEHRFERLRSQCFPAAVVDASSRREKERASLDPMSNPRPVAFPFLKLSLTRHGPCNDWCADRGK